RGQIGIHPKFWRGGIPQRELHPVEVQVRGFAVLEVDPVITQKCFIDTPCLSIGERRTPDWGEYSSIREEPEKRLLGCSAKEDRTWLDDTFEPAKRGRVKWMLQYGQCQP